MIGERNIVEVVVAVVGVERAPATVPRLQPDGPFGAARDRLVVPRPDAATSAVERADDGGGVVKVRVVRVVVLERPAAGAQIGGIVGPVAADGPAPAAGSASRARASAAASASGDRTSSMACAASAVSHTGDRHGWQ